jgi:hypothetical protein
VSLSIAALEIDLSNYITDSIQEFVGMAIRAMINPVAAHALYSSRVIGFEFIVDFVQGGISMIELVFTKCAFTVRKDCCGRMIVSDFALKQ